VKLIAKINSGEGAGGIGSVLGRRTASRYCEQSAGCGEGAHGGGGCVGEQGLARMRRRKGGRGEEEKRKDQRLKSHTNTRKPKVRLSLLMQPY